MCNDRSQLACGAGHPRVSADCQSDGQIQKAHGRVGTLKKCRDRVFLTATNENWCPMICNIRDYREHHFRWECIRAIVEPAWDHNSRPDSDRAEIGPDALDDDRREGIPPADALAGASALPDHATTMMRVWNSLKNEAYFAAAWSYSRHRNRCEATSVLDTYCNAEQTKPTEL
jgi:hypothetical protein